MTLSQDAIIRTLTLGAAMSGVRLLRTEIAKQAKTEGNPLVCVLALWFDSKLGQIQKALDKDIDRVIEEA